MIIIICIMYICMCVSAYRCVLVILIAIFFEIPHHQFLIGPRSVKLVQRPLCSVSLSKVQSQVAVINLQLVMRLQNRFYNYNTNNKRILARHIGWGMRSSCFIR